MKVKRYHLKLTAVLTAVCIIFPSFALFKGSGFTEPTPIQPYAESVYEGVFRVKEKDGSIKEYSEKDYIMGVVAAEMPASYSVEALKVQTVISYTVAVRRRNLAKSKGQTFDIEADSTIDQAFYPIEQTAKKWGGDAEMYKAKIKKAVDSVFGEVVVYNDNLIDAVFFAISNGKTEDAENVWGSEIPYLKSVDSAGDITAKGYLTTYTLSADEFKEICTENGITLSDDKTKWTGEQTFTESGQTKTIRIGDKTFTGKQIRQMFSLRSATFSIAFAEESFTFTVRGYGHGVGLSQFGANYMSEKGALYKEIICWYYGGCEVKKIDELKNLP